MIELGSIILQSAPAISSCRKKNRTRAWDSRAIPWDIHFIFPFLNEDTAFFKLSGDPHPSIKKNLNALPGHANNSKARGYCLENSSWCTHQHRRNPALLLMVFCIIFYYLMHWKMQKQMAAPSHPESGMARCQAALIQKMLWPLAQRLWPEAVRPGPEDGWEAAVWFLDSSCFMCPANLESCWSSHWHPGNCK